MTFQEIKSLITTLHNASDPGIPLFDAIGDEWQIENDV